MPVFDNLLMFHTSGSVTQSESNGPVTIRGTGIKGMAARVVVPSSAGTTTSILPRYWGSADNSTYYLFATYDGGAQAPAASGEYITPLVTDYKYVKEELVVAGTTPNFGTVISGVVEGVGYDWSRAVSFE